MTVDEATTIIFEQLQWYGTHLSRDACEHIASCILHPETTPRGLLADPPGSIAQHHRDRYED